MFFVRLAQARLLVWPRQFRHHSCKGCSPLQTVLVWRGPCRPAETSAVGYPFLRVTKHSFSMKDFSAVVAIIHNQYAASALESKRPGCGWSGNSDHRTLPEQPGLCKCSRQRGRPRRAVSPHKMSVRPRLVGGCCNPSQGRALELSRTANPVSDMRHVDAARVNSEHVTNWLQTLG